MSDVLPEFVPVILAGGSGTRFWPRSRRARAKQVLALSGEETMIQQTCERLLPLAGGKQFLVITNDLLADTIQTQLPHVQAARILREPAARNTAPACALAAMLVAKTNPDAVLGVFPSDHVVTDDARFVQRMQQGIRIAAAGANIVVLGAPPTRPETGYGYIQEGSPLTVDGVKAHTVCRFTEKPDLPHAEEFLASGTYKWNSGIFLWSAKTLISAFQEFCPAMVEPLERIAGAFGTPEFEASLRSFIRPSTASASTTPSWSPAPSGVRGRAGSTASRRILAGMILDRGLPCTSTFWSSWARPTASASSATSATAALAGTLETATWWKRSARCSWMRAATTSMRPA